MYNGDALPEDKGAPECGAERGAGTPVRAKRALASLEAPSEGGARRAPPDHSGGRAAASWSKLSRVKGEYMKLKVSKP